MAAEKLDDVSSGIARAVALAGMRPKSCQNRPRERRFLPSVSNGLGAHDQNVAPGTAPTQVAWPSAPPTLFTGRPIALIHSGAPFRVPFSS